MNFGSYWFSDKIVLRMYQAQEVGAGHRLYAIVERLSRAGRPADAEGLHHSRSVAERVRDRPESLARRGRGDRRDPAGPQRHRARRGDRARAGARQAPRHPHQLRRGDDCRGDHDGRRGSAQVGGDVRRLRRPRRRPRSRQQPDRAAGDDHPGADRRDADSDGDFAVARVRGRRRRRADRRQSVRAGRRAAQDRRGVQAGAARRQPGDGAHVHHQAVLRRGADVALQQPSADRGSHPRAAAAASGREHARPLVCDRTAGRTPSSARCGSSDYASAFSFPINS